MKKTDSTERTRKNKIIFLNLGDTLETRPKAICLQAESMDSGQRKGFWAMQWTLLKLLFYGTLIRQTHEHAVF